MDDLPPAMDDSLEITTSPLTTSALQIVFLWLALGNRAMALHCVLICKEFKGITRDVRRKLVYRLTTNSTDRIQRWMDQIRRLGGTIFDVIFIWNPTEEIIDLTPLPEGIATLEVVCLNKTPFDLQRLSGNITKLKLTGDFNQPVEEQLPSNLTQLTVGNFFNQPLEQLPATLTYLSIGIGFKQSLEQLPKLLPCLKRFVYHDVLCARQTQQFPERIQQVHYTVDYKP